MVAIVLVSHSEALARGTRELAAAMGNASVAIAAGMDGGLGTNPIAIQHAIESVWNVDGVVVLMDLGSALLSAETALELLSEAQRRRVRLCPAPFVEGAVAAVVQASGGASLDEVAREAAQALDVKQQHLPVALPVEKTAFISNFLGLHARPASRLVRVARQFSGPVQLTVGDRTADAKSINALLTLGVRKGDTVRVAGAADAVAAVAAWLTSLHELEVNAYHFVGGAPGVAIGPAHRLDFEVLSRDVLTNEGQIEQALAAARVELDALRSSMAANLGEEMASILDLQRMLLDDPELLRWLDDYEGRGSGNPWLAAIEDMAQRMEAMADPYQRARAADVRDLGLRVMRHLGVALRPALPLVPSVMVAQEMTPSQVAELPPELVVGIVTAGGSNTSHAVILARALGVPAVTGAGEVVVEMRNGETVALEGESGAVWLRPHGELRASLERRAAAWREAARPHYSEPAVTGDGRAVPVLANLQGADVGAALAAGAEGVGLLRTEFLFLDRAQPPSEAEQAAIYRAMAEALGERPLVIRTLDVGGDKPVAYLPVQGEANPFLGWRGVRQSLECRELFAAQLRAIRQAGPNVRVMFPMVATAEEVRAARELLGDGIPVGIMIEVPAAAVMADRLAPMVDFFSIGTNDLTQYTMAADRTNPRVAALGDALQPAVLRLIEQTAAAAHHARIPVAVCGEIAADPTAVPLLIGLGVDELSVSPPAIARTRAAITSYTLAACREAAAHACQQDSAAAVRLAQVPKNRF